MYFKKLELIGFKSFCNKTALQFEPGVTAIVGPNGCGKSNIFDSIRWVLGEQSAKSLRGSNMEDVIFNGTDSKEALSLAEVNLTFDNSGKFFPVDSNEVLITRRIFRSGESEYLLNKTLVRLKDIQDLLLGTGIGAESYSIIPQGKIDMILSSKPEERRLVFDEASGITKYKSQKREALRRLDETEQNLLRVNDIIAEVKRQIGSLERQANKARRYKEAFDELRSKEIGLALLQKSSLQNEKNNLSAEILSLESKENQLLSTIREQEAQIAVKQSELKAIEEKINGKKNSVITLDNQLLRNKEKIESNKERILELNENKENLIALVQQVKDRLKIDEEKLNSLRDEYNAIKITVQEKSNLLKEKEDLLHEISSSIKKSAENIDCAKKLILEILAKSTNLKNELNDLNSKQQIYLARKKRLELERIKVDGERAAFKANLDRIGNEVGELEVKFQQVSSKAAELKLSLENENNQLDKISADIEDLEKTKLSLKSQKQFLTELKTKYDDISESLNATITLDRIPQEKISGLVIKITDFPQASPGDSFKITGEAKPFDLDTTNITSKIELTENKISELKILQEQKNIDIKNIGTSLEEALSCIHNDEIELANKKANLNLAQEQFNKINDEESLIDLELSDVEADFIKITERAAQLNNEILDVDNRQKANEELISSEQENIASYNYSKEDALVFVARLKTELDGLLKRLNSEVSTLETLEKRYLEDKDNLTSLEKQIAESETKNIQLEGENKELGEKIIQINMDIATTNVELKEIEAKFELQLKDAEEYVKNLDAHKLEMEDLKNKSYELQLRFKDIEFKYSGIKERLAQAYKVDIENLSLEESVKIDNSDSQNLNQEISALKDKVDSYGSVNLVAIEEYDELKKRYDFLTQQQTDLVTGKEALHEAILKINRTTKKLFLETFEKVKVEFRNYFKLLFNGGDAQVYLVDENDPLESGIEIICRPPGKKLQNVLLLSGGEKSMSAIALIFAIFKIKPAPFCVLDEIDAALDEANVDRFGRALQEFAKISQFIVITHNKKTIANADIMYGITMEESGVSKIVSVKFAQKQPPKEANTTPDSQPVAEPEPV